LNIMLVSPPQYVLPCVLLLAALVQFLYNFVDVTSYLSDTSKCPALRLRRPAARSLPARFQLPTYSPSRPVDVLQFWYGPEAYPAHVDWLDDMSPAGYMAKRMPVLMGGGNFIFDAECAAFTRLVVLIGTQSMELTSEWNEPWGAHARLLLLDQLPRNIFRGTGRQYEYGAFALEIAREFAMDPSAHLHNFPVSAVRFTFVALLHSENLADFDLCHRLVLQMASYTGESLNNGTMGHIFQNYLDHRNIIEMFGRFPHRNEMLRRVSTSREEIWLRNTRLPGWAEHAQSDLSVAQLSAS